MFTFAVVGHNEAPLLATAVRQAMEAVEPGDGVWFVDSESSDDSAAVARSLGAEVVPAPLGKGRAMAAALIRFLVPRAGRDASCVTSRSAAAAPRTR